MSSTKPIFSGLVCALLSACAMTGEDPGAPAEPAAEVAATEAGAIVRFRYRHGETELVATFRETKEGQELVPGPDDGAISELLNQPTAGVAQDPSQPELFHVYTNAEEQAAVQEALRNAPRTVIESDEPAPGADPAPPGVRAQALCTNPAGCNWTCPTDYGYADASKAVNFLVGSLRIDDMPSLASFGFNDVISSVYLEDGQITLYEHPNFGGHSITFVPDMEVRYSTGCGYTFASIPDLRNYTMISRWYWTNVSWNDQASSAYFYSY